ncbi:5'-nucleotidase SurE [compost metagenome]
MALRILVSNDDGVYSPGIAALAEVAAEFGTVRVVAPDVEMSSAPAAARCRTAAGERQFSA